MRVPPHSRDAEEAILGAVLFDPKNYDKVQLKPDDFYDPRNAELWSVMHEMRASGLPLDSITVRQYADDNGSLEKVGGEDHLLTVQDYMIGLGSIGHYSKIVLDKSKLRREISIISDGLEKSYDGSSCSADVMSNLAGLSLEQQEDVELYEHAKSYIQNCKEGKVGHFNWWCPDWTNKLGRMSSDLMILHAQRSTGKTALMLQWIVNAHMGEQRTPLASIEMLRKELAPRLLANIGHVNTFRMRSRGFITDDEEVRSSEAAESLKVLELCIRDKSMTIDDIRSWAVIEHRNGADAIFIDNLLSISDGGKQYQSKTIMYDDFIRKFRDLRDTLKIPIILLAHPNADGAVAWSKDVENFADVILYLANVPEDGLPTRVGKVERLELGDSYKHVVAIFQKNRQGISPVASISFHGDTQTFEHVKWEGE